MNLKDGTLLNVAAKQQKRVDRFLKNLSVLTARQKKQENC